MNSIGPDFDFTRGQASSRHPRPDKHQWRHPTGSEDFPITRTLTRSQKTRKEIETKEQNTKPTKKRQELKT